jgi:kynureninase
MSNPPILSLAPLKASLALFDRATIRALREKSERLTGFMDRLIGLWCPSVRRVTPAEPQERGCQISLLAPGGRETLRALLRAGVVVDFREPDVIRAAPAPLYNSFHDVWRFAATLRGVLGGR